MNVTQPLTLIGRAAFPNQVGVEFWGLAAPNEGQGVITVRLDATGGFVAGALSFTGVHQTASTGPVTAAMGTSDTASLAVTSATGQAIASVYAGNGIVLPVARAPHVGRWSFQGLLLGAGGSEPGRAGATVIWDTPGASQPWLLGAVSVRPAVTTQPMPDAAPPDLPPDLSPDLPPDAPALPPDAPLPVDLPPPPADTALPPDAPPVGVDAPPVGMDAAPVPGDGPPVSADAQPGPADGGVPADATPGPADTGGGGTDAGASDRLPGGADGSDGGVSVYDGAYDIGCACRVDGRRSRSGGQPLPALLLVLFVGVALRRRPPGR
jgi:MYXO-CTERM domain-containing protein